MIRALPLLTVPILVGSLRGCGQMALVADSRAFGVNRRRTTYRQVAWTCGDRVAVGAGALLIAGTIAVITVGGGRF
jgi:energy-coupling factor transport system permease protein